LTQGRWLPMVYRGFYDIPRMVAVTLGETTYLLHCPFDESLDDYSPYFDVYQLPAGLEDLQREPAWDELPRMGRRVGRVPVDKVEFDSSRRETISASFLDHLEP
jgi:hypothetical protein